MLRERQLVAYNEANEQQQQGQQEKLFCEALVERGRMEEQCQQLAMKLHRSEHQAAMIHNGAVTQIQELKDQNTRNGMLYGETASMARLSLEQETRLSECIKELATCRSEEEACQKESRQLRHEYDVAEACVGLWQESTRKSQEELVVVWTEIEILKKQNEQVGEDRTIDAFTTPSTNQSDDRRQTNNVSEATDRSSRKIKEADKIDVRTSTADNFDCGNVENTTHQRGVGCIGEYRYRPSHQVDIRIVASRRYGSAQQLGKSGFCHVGH
jgi:hypothetical protein